MNAEHPGIRKAIKIVGSENRLAMLLIMSRGDLYRIRTGQRQLRPELALKIVAVTNGKVRRHELRPDLW